MKLAEQKLTVAYIINTHGHFDHVGANRKLKEATGAKLVIHALDQSMLEVLSETSAAFGLSVENSPPPDQTVQDGDTLQFGEITLTVLHTPGHTPGGISLHTDGVVFVGDTLFAGSIGRTDFPGGDFDTLISSIRNKLYPLGDQVIVYTGTWPGNHHRQGKTLQSVCVHVIIRFRELSSSRNRLYVFLLDLFQKVSDVALSHADGSGGCGNVLFILYQLSFDEFVFKGFLRILQPGD